MEEFIEKQKKIFTELEKLADEWRDKIIEERCVDDELWAAVRQMLTNIDATVELNDGIAFRKTQGTEQGITMSIETNFGDFKVRSPRGGECQSFNADEFWENERKKVQGANEFIESLGFKLKPDIPASIHLPGDFDGDPIQINKKKKSRSDIISRAQDSVDEQVKFIKEAVNTMEHPPFKVFTREDVGGLRLLITELINNFETVAEELIQTKSTDIRKDIKELEEDVKAFKDRLSELIQDNN